MTAKFFAILTNQGAAKLANATALGTKLDLTQLAVGDGGGTLPMPDPSQTALKGEKRRAAINMLSVDPANPNQIIAEQVIPESEGGWWIREIGLFDKDGTLIAVANCPETYKPQLQEGSGRTQTIRMILIVSSTEAVTLKIDPAVVLATRDYVDNAITAHAQSRNHPDASTAAKGFVQLSSATNSTSEVLAATPKAVKAAYDLAASKLSSVPDATTTAKGIVQLNSATNSTSEALAATPKAVKAAYDLAASKLSSVPDATTTTKGIVQLNSAIDSTSEVQAATPKAIKTVSDAAAKLAQNLADLPDKALSRKNLELKAGALRDVGTVSGNLMEVGAFGLGGMGIMITDANSADKSGFYSLEANKSSNTPNVSASWEMLCIKYDDGSAKQLFWQAGSATTKTYVRYRTSPGRVWGDFEYYYSTENKPTAADIGLGNVGNFMAVQQGGVSNQLKNKIYIGWGTDGKLRLTVDNSDQGVIYTTNSPPPYPVTSVNGNTGAVMLRDGFSTDNTGLWWDAFSSQLRIQAGVWSIGAGAGASTTVIFPKAFPNWCLFAVPVPDSSMGSAAATEQIGVSGRTNTTVTFTKGIGDAVARGGKYLAIGY